MNRLLLLSGLLLLVVLTAFKPHPLHLGVLELNYRSGDKRLEVMVKLFRDDLAAALSRHGRTKVAEDLSDAKTPQITAYVSEKLKLKAGNQALRLEYVGREAADDAEWLYFEAACPQAAFPLRVENRLLFELFDDQDHFLHFSTDGERRRSFRLNAERPAVVIEG